MRRLFMIPIILILLSGCAGKQLPEDTEYISSLPFSHIQTDELKIGYRTFGSGKPLLLIMGFAGTMDIWDASFIRTLSAEHTVIIFDNRGMGESGRGNSAITIGQMAVDAAALLNKLGYAKADVLGWSMGGLIAQEMALRSPDKVNKLILMGASCENKAVADITRRLLSMDTRELISHIFPPGWQERYPDAISRLPQQKRKPDPEIIKAQAKAMINWSGCCEKLASLPNSTLIISGTDDDILPEILSMEIAREIKGSWLARYKNATHWLMYQDPESLAMTINSFLEINQDMMP